VKQPRTPQTPPVGSAGGGAGKMANGIESANIMLKVSSINPPTIIEHKQRKMMIMDAPYENTVAEYIEMLKQHEITDIVRTCERTYKAADFDAVGITVHDLQFPDGKAPPPETIDKWIEIYAEVYNKKKGRIAVHCLAGLGRAPVLTAIALIEQGKQPIDAILMIRERRKGAINAKQLEFLETYKPRSKGRGLSGFCSCFF